MTQSAFFNGSSQTRKAGARKTPASMATTITTRKVFIIQTCSRKSSGPVAYFLLNTSLPVQGRWPAQARGQGRSSDYKLLPVDADIRMKVEWHQPAKETYNLKNVPYASLLTAKLVTKWILKNMSHSRLIVQNMIGIRQNVCFPWASMISVYLSDIWFLKKL